MRSTSGQGSCAGEVAQLALPPAMSCSRLCRPSMRCCTGRAGDADRRAWPPSGPTAGHTGLLPFSWRSSWPGGSGLPPATAKAVKGLGTGERWALRPLWLPAGRTSPLLEEPAGPADPARLPPSTSGFLPRPRVHKEAAAAVAGGGRAMVGDGSRTRGGSTAAAASAGCWATGGACAGGAAACWAAGSTCAAGCCAAAGSWSACRADSRPSSPARARMSSEADPGNSPLCRRQVGGVWMRSGMAWDGPPSLQGSSSGSRVLPFCRRRLSCS